MKVYIVYIYDHIYECNVSEVIAAENESEAMKIADEAYSDGQYEALSAELLTYTANGIRIECRVITES